MVKNNDILNELLGIANTKTESTTIPKANTTATEVAVIKQQEDPIVVKDALPSTTQDDDAAFARRKMRNVIKVAEEAASELALIASDTQQPRAYEVLANLLKTTSEATKELLVVHKTQAEINRLNISIMTNFDRQKLLEDPSNVNTGNQVNIDKAVFVGTPNDLLEHLDAIKKKEIEDKSDER